MRTAVIGSRSFTDYILLKQTLDQYTISAIVSGGARGADQLGEQYALETGLPTLILRPDYDKFGRKAPLLNNLDIIDAAEQVIAFWDGNSRGTAHALTYARKKGKHVHIIQFISPDQEWYE